MAWSEESAARRRQKRADRRASGLCIHCGASAGRFYACSKCRRGRAEYRVAKIDSFKSRSKAYLREKKLEVFKHYGNKCQCCDEDCPDFLTIDHPANDGNSERSRLKRHGSNFYLWVISQGFPSRLRLLCFNCNLGRRIAGGICPHQTAKRPASDQRSS